MVPSLSTYLEALERLTNCTLYYGQYQNESRECRRCSYPNITPSEKMTDVNIAVEIMTDAFENNSDTAYVISADSDLTPPVRIPNKVAKANGFVLEKPANWV